MMIDAGDGSRKNWTGGVKHQRQIAGVVVLARGLAWWLAGKSFKGRIPNP